MVSMPPLPEDDMATGIRFIPSVWYVLLHAGRLYYCRTCLLKSGRGGTELEGPVVNNITRAA